MNPLLLVLAAAFLIGVSVPGLVVILRAPDAIQALVRAGVKPWACDLCMCLWTTFSLVALAAASLGEPRVLLAAGPSYTLSLLVLRVVQAPYGASSPTKPPDL